MHDVARLPDFLTQVRLVLRATRFPRVAPLHAVVVAFLVAGCSSSDQVGHVELDLANIASIDSGDATANKLATEDSLPWHIEELWDNVASQQFSLLVT